MKKLFVLFLSILSLSLWYNVVAASDVVKSEEYIDDLQKGWERRSAFLSDNQEKAFSATNDEEIRTYYLNLVLSESLLLTPYIDKTFEDPFLQDYAESYLYGVRLQYQAVTQHWKDKATFEEQWQKGYTYRAYNLYAINELYPLEIDDAYSQDFNTMLSDGAMAYQAQNTSGNSNNDVEAYTEEIRFRDIEWGTSLDQARTFLPEGISLYPPREDSAFSVEKAMYDEGDGYYNGHVCCFVTADSSSLDGFQVAGYDVAGLHMRFAFLPDEINGMLNKNEKNTALYYAYYELNPKDPDAVYQDLLNKLTSLYGDVDITKSSGYSIKSTYNTWFGANRTLVTLQKDDYSSGSHVIYIKYSFLDGNKLLQKAHDALVLEESQKASSNVDGL